MGSSLHRNAGELERLLGSDRLARPSKCFGGRGGTERDPSPLWDIWYSEFTPTERRRCATFMGGTVGPDTLATWLATDVDSAMRTWRTACLLELDGLAGSAVDTYGEAPTEPGYDDLVGIQELAVAFDKSPGAIRLWKMRGRLPAPDYTVSGTPIWRWGPLADKFSPEKASGDDWEQEQI